MRLLSEVISRRITAEETFTAFYAMAEPKLVDVLERVGKSQRFDRVIVYPHLLFQGKLYEAIEGQMRAAAEKHSHVDWRLADYLYATGEDAIAAAVADRVEQVWARGSRVTS